MEHDGKNFHTNRIGDIFSFAEFLGTMDVLRLDHEIKDGDDRVLVQAKRPLRDSILQSLLNRGMEEKLTLKLENYDGLKNSITDKIRIEIEKLLSLKSFSFPAHLLSKSDVDTFRVLRGALNNSSFYGMLALELFKNNPRLEHMFEVALTSIGILASSKPDTYDYGELILLFQAGILHDFSTMASMKWEEEEDFESGNSNHDIESAILLKGKGLDEKLPPLIESHNRLKNIYVNTTKKELWFTDNYELSKVTLQLVEYFTYIKRLMQAESDPTAKVIYYLSLKSEQGFLPAPLLSVFLNYYTTYMEFFKFGSEIGKIERMCPHGNYAMAYPKPKCTQVLCKDPEVPCTLRLASNPIKVVSMENENFHSRLSEKLEPGWYEKCSYSDKLPEPPADL